MLIRLLVLAMQAFVLTFAFRYVGFNAEQTVVLTLGIIAAIHIQ